MSKRFCRIYHKVKNQWFSHITGNQGNPVEWVNEIGDANTFALADLATAIHALLWYEKASEIKVRTFRVVRSSDHDAVMQSLKKTRKLLRQINHDDRKTIEQLRSSLSSEEKRLTLMRAENARLHAEAKKLWEALTPFGKMMRSGDRANLADPKWHGDLVIQRGTSIDMTIVDERDIAQAGVAWRECWFGEGDPPDDDGCTAEPDQNIDEAKPS